VKDFHREQMLSALSIAENARYLSPPNPMVGAVIVKDGKVIGKGFTHKPGKDHAEIDAIKNVYKDHQSKAKELLYGSTLYVTLEPCSSSGRTPACTEAIIKEGISEVYFAAEDPLQNGISALTEAGITVQSGLLKKEALEMNRGFFSRVNRKRPFVTCKIACSMDGGIGLKTAGEKWITSKRSREDVHRLRATSDSILTGIGTVLADNPKFTVRNKGFEDKGNQIHPKRYVLDSKLKLKGDEHLLNDGLETTIFCNKLRKVDYDQPPVNILEAPGEDGRVSLDQVMHHLNRLKCNSLMIEAGQKINTSFIKASLIDELIFYVAPIKLGENKINFTEIESSFSNIGTIRLEQIEKSDIGPDTKLITKPIYL
tara:strand:- start:1677 stop:2786 length:1110 start_codon:yes stop_codon:yes gene_type:complete